MKTINKTEKTKNFKNIQLSPRHKDLYFHLDDTRAYFRQLRLRLIMVF